MLLDSFEGFLTHFQRNKDQIFGQNELRTQQPHLKFLSQNFRLIFTLFELLKANFVFTMKNLKEEAEKVFCLSSFVLILKRYVSTRISCSDEGGPD